MSIFLASTTSSPATAMIAGFVHFHLDQLTPLLLALVLGSAYQHSSPKKDGVKKTQKGRWYTHILVPESLPPLPLSPPAR